MRREPMVAHVPTPKNVGESAERSVGSGHRSLAGGPTDRLALPTRQQASQTQGSCWSCWRASIDVREIQPRVSRRFHQALRDDHTDKRMRVVWLSLGAFARLRRSAVRPVPSEWRLRVTFPPRLPAAHWACVPSARLLWLRRTSRLSRRR